MAIPRSGALTSQTPAAQVRTSANITFTSIAAAATTNFTVALPRTFKPNRPIEVVFPNGLQNGLVVGNVTVTGNSPSSGASVKGYTLNIPITNTSAAAITPTAAPSATRTSTGSR